MAMIEKKKAQVPGRASFPAGAEAVPFRSAVTTEAASSIEKESGTNEHTG